jgi:hypothetical protein
VQTIIDRAVVAPPCPRQHGSTRGFTTQDHPIAGFTRILVAPLPGDQESLVGQRTTNAF